MATRNIVDRMISPNIVSGLRYMLASCRRNSRQPGLESPFMSDDRVKSSDRVDSVSLLMDVGLLDLWIEMCVQQIDNEVDHQIDDGHQQGESHDYRVVEE